jgi:hypothetical protein
VSRPVPARLALAVSLGFLLASPAAAASPVTWTDVERVVAFADVHGAYAELVALLREAGVVDGGLRWSAGKTHVVSTGDLLDRGADSRKVMDLLMRLQGEAARAGGRLHFRIPPAPPRPVSPSCPHARPAYPIRPTLAGRRTTCTPHTPPR